MRWPRGPGPVFAIELRAAARRWQTYAARAAFIVALLGAFAFVWWADVGPRGLVSVNDMARVGAHFYYGLVGTQLALLLLAAPAATAGAVCVDKARGSLLHLLVTDLSNSEIVLGKLAARLTPVFGLLLAGLPVLGAGTLLGGIAPETAFGAFLISAGVAVLGCSLALALSVRAGKTHEVLLAAYGLEAVALLALPVWFTAGQIVRGGPGGWGMPAWLRKSNPFWLAFAPYSSPGASDAYDPLLSLAGALVLSAVLALFAIVTVRRAAVRHGAVVTRPRRRLRLPSVWRRLPGPSLDGNPVLWREWHRRQPSRWLRVVWGLFALAACGLTGLVVVLDVFSGHFMELGPVLIGLIVTLGLLLFSVSAVTSLSEERLRGSLDVLLATPLPTRSIVWGKWWGTFRTVPLLAVLPGFYLVTMMVSNHLSDGRVARYPGVLPARLQTWTLTPQADWVLALLVVALILAYGAALTSLGLALATRISRTGRAAACCATAFVVMTVVPVFASVLFVSRSEAEAAWLLTACPFWGTGATTAAAVCLNGENLRQAVIGPAIAWVFIYLAVAGVLQASTLWSFDRCLGRARQGIRPARVPVPARAPLVQEV